MCWAANPEDRPSFLGLSGIFGTILGNQSVRNVKYFIRISNKEDSAHNNPFLF
jgi:hypothetical protein